MSRRGAKKRVETASLKGGCTWNLTCGAYKNGGGKLGLSYNTQEWVIENGIDGNSSYASGTSIFDPVLCELMYKWFCPVGGKVLDPFAGGSVRGIVAAKMGMEYTGIELRPEQVAANEAQRQEICKGSIMPQWITGDSRDINKLVEGPFDFLFSCPPYADLERYSDDPKDLSTMAYSDFMAAYREIIGKCYNLCYNDSFACFVVGEVRDKKGIYYGFVPDTIRAFTDAGYKYYNEIILVTMVGSLPISVGKQFEASRKIGKTHQNVLVFVKGDPKEATAKINNK